MTQIEKCTLPSLRGTVMMDVRSCDTIEAVRVSAATGEPFIEIKLKCNDGIEKEKAGGKSEQIRDVSCVVQNE